VDLHVDLIKDGMTTYGTTANPFFMPGRHEPAYDEYLTFVGLSVTPTASSTTSTASWRTGRRA
jgi:formamidase